VFLGINKNTPMKIAEGILEGIKYFMEKKIDSKVVGGHTIYSEWPLIEKKAFFEGKSAGKLRDLSIKMLLFINKEL
ncbi:unnamed protein product, partial [marine sediment metagenome]